MSSEATTKTTPSVLYPCSTDGKLDYTTLLNYPECVTGIFWLSHDYKSDGLNANKFGEKTESSPIFLVYTMILYTFLYLLTSV